MYVIAGDRFGIAAKEVGPIEHARHGTPDGSLIVRADGNGLAALPINDGHLLARTAPGGEQTLSRPAALA